MQEDTRRTGLITTGLVLLLYVLGRYLGPILFENNWSFGHWRHLPAVFGVAWIVVLAAAAWLVYRHQETIGAWFSNRRHSLIMLGVLALIFWFFRFDAPLYGAGNERVADLARSEMWGAAVVYRWFEFGVMLLGHLFFRVLDGFGLAPNLSASLAWRFVSWFSAALALAATLRLTSLLTVNRTRRFFLAVLVFCGPQALLYFGFIGVESVIIPVTLWFAVFATRVIRLSDYRALLGLWAVTILGLVLHITAAFLVPAAVYVSLRSLLPRTGAKKTAVPVALAVMVFLIAVAYWLISNNLEYASVVLFLAGKGPFLDYGIVSWRHLGDIVQLLFLAVPLLIVGKLIAWQRLRSMFADPLFVTAWFMSLGAFAVIMIADPFNSIVLDLPRFLAYLTPFGVFIAIIVSLPPLHEGGEARRPTLSPLLAVVSVFILLAYAPLYINTARSEAYVSNYLDKNDGYYRGACVSLRDSFSFIGNQSKTNEWQTNQRVKSPDYINLEGSLFLVQDQHPSEAIPVLHQMMVRSPYWAEPRSLLAQTYIQQNRPDLAKPHIDTCLMLEPYNRTHMFLQYQYFRDIKKYAEAFQQLERAREHFSGDTAMVTQEMLITFLMGEMQGADSLADDIIMRDPNQAYPYWVKGRVADRRRQFEEAIIFYDDFLDRVPSGDMQAGGIQRRIELLDSVINMP